MAVYLSVTFALLKDNGRLIVVPCFVGSPKSPDPNLSFIEIESRLREKIRVNGGELRQVSYYSFIVSCVIYNFILFITIHPILKSIVPH